jgi:hypothetical protein
LLALFAGLMNFDDIAIWIMKENLIPASNRPRTEIRVRDALLFKSPLEPLNIVGPEAEMAALNWIDDLLHPETKVDILTGNVKLDDTIGQEVHVACIASRIVGIDALVLGDAAKTEHGSVEC